MKKTIYTAILILSLYVFLSASVVAQEDIDQKILDLRKQIEELERKAEEYSKNINQRQKEGVSLKQEIEILNNQILRLQTKINITSQKIKSAKLEIADLESRLFDTQEKIEFKKRSIGQIVSLLYRRDQESLLAIVLKNNTISQFADEIEQVKDLNNALLELLVSLKKAKEDLENKKLELDLKKQELEKLNSKQISSKVSLDGTKLNKATILNKTKGEEVKYRKLLNEVEKKKAEFFEELRKLESEAIDKGAFIVHVTAVELPPKGIKIFDWPEDDYILTQSYGHTSYSRRGTYGGAPHNGLDLTSGYGTPIRAIGDGAILTSGFNNGWGFWVAVRHPNNLVSVYAHLRAPSALNNGTAVKKGDIIGYEGSTGNATGSHLHLSLYRDFFTYINEKNSQLYFNYFDGSINPLDYL